MIGGKSILVFIGSVLLMISSASALQVRADWNDLDPDYIYNGETDYPGALLGQFGGIGFETSDDWGDTKTIMVESGDLTAPAETHYALTQTSPSQCIQGVYDPGRQSTRGLAEALTGTVWFSFLIQQPTSNSVAGIGMNQNGYSVKAPFIVATGNDIRISLGSGSQDVYINDVLEYEQTALILGKIEIDTGPAGQDYTSVWVNPDVQNPGTPDSSITGYNYLSSITRVAVISYANDAEGGLLDMLVLSDDEDAYADVTGVLDDSRAANIAPADSQSDITGPVTLRWHRPTSFEPVGYDVYFGKDPIVENNPKVINGQLQTAYDAGTLDFETTYYWRVDSYETSSSKTTGWRWSFTTAPARVQPVLPKNDANNVSLSPSLIWKVPLEVAAIAFDVYLSADATIDAGDMIVDKQYVQRTDAASLLENHTYYWRVDIYESSAPNTAVAGPVSTFTTCTELSMPDTSQTVLVEAESFDHTLVYADEDEDLGPYEAGLKYGGWVLDQQFMDQMGSPYLLAHGVNQPVADAETTVTFPAAGTYKVWVRTRDWTATWRGTEWDAWPNKKALGDPPGRFEVRVNGTALETGTAWGTAFGTSGAEWQWHEGGTVTITDPSVHIVLHDLTGWEGRCDAILFSRDLSLVPPEHTHPQSKQWRRTLLSTTEIPTEAGHYNLVVVGGGMAGMSTALSASRQGLSVALIQDRPVLGGNSSSEVRVDPLGQTNFSYLPSVGSISREIRPDSNGNRLPDELAKDSRRISILQAEPLVDLYIMNRANEVEMTGNTIVAVIAENIQTAERTRFTADLFADCTGDGCIGYLAGADWDMTLPGHMGRTRYFYWEDTNGLISFPDCPWAIQIDGRDVPRWDRPNNYPDLGGWAWESGLDHDPFEKNEYIQDWSYRVMYGVWDGLKNDPVTAAAYANRRIWWTNYIAGKRESRRLLGDVYLTKTDMTSGFVFPDGCVPLKRSMDVHVPAPDHPAGFDGDWFITDDTYAGYTGPYWAPYRILYSRNIENLYMAGRDVSVDQWALGAIRVQFPTSMSGEVIGVAASLCQKYGVLPRDIYTDHLDEFLAILKKMHRKEVRKMGHNLALAASISVSSNEDKKSYINDGEIDFHANDSLLWKNDVAGGDELPCEIDFTWSTPTWISACRIASGYDASYESVKNENTYQISDFELQRWDGSSWQTFHTVTGNVSGDWGGTFSPVRTDSEHPIRVIINARHLGGEYIRIREIEFYHLPADINMDGRVNLGDFAELADHWLQSGTGLAGDIDWDWTGSEFNFDGDVDWMDLDYLIHYWLNN